MSPSGSVLVIDEIPMFRELEAAVLGRLAKVFTAASGEEGIDLARELRPDVLIVDLLMPDCDGAAVCWSVKNDPDLRDTRVAVVLSRDLAEDRARAVRAGADEVLHKPIQRMELLSVVRRLLRRPVQGAPRADLGLGEPVRIERGSAVSWGCARNLSRGGVFVETDESFPLESEVRLEFRLPGVTTTLSTSAKVVWARAGNGDAGGMGMRFVALDGASARRVDEFVYERAPNVREPVMGGTPG